MTCGFALQVSISVKGMVLLLCVVIILSARKASATIINPILSGRPNYNPYLTLLTRLYMNHRR